MYVLDPIQDDRPRGGAQSNVEAATCAKRLVGYASNGDGAVSAAETLGVFALLGCLLTYAAHLQPQ